jgi:uncharacterized membrane protein YphA (DoxX/SURF4 family)
MNNKNDWGLLLIRLSLAGVFLFHGISKIMNLPGTVGFFGQLGLPAFLAYAVAFGETLAGLAMMSGLYTKYAGWFIAAVMAGAVYFAKFPSGGLQASEFELVLLVVALGVSLVGPGSYTVKRWLGKS